MLAYARRNGGVPTADMKLPTLLTYNVESGYYDHIYNKVWLGGFLNGLRIFTFDEGGTLIEHELSAKDISNPVRSIIPYNDHTMLVGIDGMGVYKVQRQPSASGVFEGELLFDANEGKEGVLHGNGVYAVMCDSWENIIIGTYSGGIDIARPVGSTPALFQHIRDNQQSLQNDHVNCVAQLPDGMLVMGTDNGVSLHNPLTQQWIHACRGAVVLSLCITPDATLLAATYGKGVYEIKENGASRQLYTKKDGVLKDDHVYKLFYDREGCLWMGCLDGELVKVDRGNAVHYYPINNVQDITQLPDGKIAVGTANGIRLIDTTTDEVGELDYSVANPDDINKYIHTLYVNDNNELWIGTDGGGVYVYELKKTCRQLTTANGLPSNTVCSIDKDCKGGVPCLFGLDQNHGSTYTQGGTLFPQNINVAATFNRDIARRSAEATAYETRAVSVPWTFSPTLDLARDARWPRFYENFGEDCYVNAEMGVAQTLGFQGEDPNHVDQQHVAVSLKHYMGYSVPWSGKDRTSAYIAPAQLREKFFAPFLACVKAGAHSIMVNSASVNGMPVHANRELLTVWLKEQTGWDGVCSSPTGPT